MKSLSIRNQIYGIEIASERSRPRLLVRNHVLFLQQDLTSGIGLNHGLLISTEFYEIVEEFRSYIRMHQTQKINQNTHSAFASEKKKEGQRQGATFNGQKTPDPCLCGMIHWYNNCYYLVSEKRSSNWSPNPATQA